MEAHSKSQVFVPLFPQYGAGHVSTQVLSNLFKYNCPAHSRHFTAVSEQVLQFSLQGEQILLLDASPNSLLRVQVKAHSLVPLLPQYGGVQEERHVFVGGYKYLGFSQLVQETAVDTQVLQFPSQSLQILLSARSPNWFADAQFSLQVRVALLPFI